MQNTFHDLWGPKYIQWPTIHLDCLQFLQTWGVAHCLSYASYPQSNGRAEAMVVTVHVKCTQTALHMHKNLCVVYPAHTDYYALRKKTTTTIAYLISTAVQNPYSHVQHLILNLLHPYLKFQPHLIDLSQSDIQILYGLSHH